MYSPITTSIFWSVAAIRSNSCSLRSAGAQQSRARADPESEFCLAFFVHSDFDCAGPRFVRPLIARLPSFFFTQFHPNPEIEDRISARHHTLTESPHKDVLRIGALITRRFSTRPAKRRVHCLCRQDSSCKNQLELVRDYRETIYNKWAAAISGRRIFGA